MTDNQIARFIAMASNELLRSIVAGTASKRDAFLRYYAKRELDRRDMIVTLA